MEVDETLEMGSAAELLAWRGRVSERAGRGEGEERSSLRPRSDLSYPLSSLYDNKEALLVRANSWTYVCCCPSSSYEPEHSYNLRWPTRALVEVERGREYELCVDEMGSLL